MNLITCADEYDYWSRFAMKFLPNHMRFLAQDVVQNSWIKCRNARVDNERAYFHKAIRACVYDILKAEGKHPQEDHEMEMVDVGQEQRHDVRVFLQQILHAIENSIPNKTHVLIYKLWLNGEKQKDIASDLNISTSGVFYVISSINRIIREHLSDDHSVQ